MYRPRRVLLIGQGITARSALESLVERLDLVGVARPAPAAGEPPDPVAERARRLQVPVFADTSPAAIEALVERLAPEAVVVSSYDRVLPPALLARSRFVNVHYSPLPRYRGRANVNWALINDEPACAITIHSMAPGLDAGRVLHQELVPVGARDTVGDLYRRLDAIQQRCLAQAVLEHLDGYQGVEQDERDASWGCARGPDDGLIDWSATTRRIDCLVRALDEPFPGAFTYLGGRRLVVWRAEPLEAPPRYAGRVPGRVAGRSDADGSVQVLTGDGVLRLLEVQLEGEAPAPAAQVIRSVRATLGLRPAELLATVARLERQVAALAEQVQALTEARAGARGASRGSGPG